MSGASTSGRSAEILRDEWGIPHVRAATAADVAYGQGLATAQDRAWQLSWLGWRAAGRTAEHVGAAGLEWDLFARRIGLAAAAQRGFDRLSPEAAAFTAAYAAGVNDGLAQAGPPEWAALGVAAPTWPDWMPLGAFAVHHILFGTIGTKLWRLRVARSLGVEALELLRRDGADPAPATVGATEEEPFPLDAALLERVLAELSDLDFPPGREPASGVAPESGSNAYAVGAGRTESGVPLVAGDPHRVHELPNVYHQVQLAGPDFDVVGLAFVGVPGIPHFAHAGSVAWGITNAIADYQDLYVERLRVVGPEISSRTGTGWAPVARTRETVPVRGADPVPVEILTTRHGPVILQLGDDVAVSVRTPGLKDRSDLGFESLLPLLRARTAADVRAAFDGWVEPVNNLVVADTTGALEYRTVGVVPRRSRANQWLPVPGWDEAYAWQGLLGVADLPRWDAPADGQIVTANQRISTDSGAVGAEYAEPDRARRISALLAGRHGLTVADLAAVHADVAQRVPPGLVAVLEQLTGLSEAATGLRDEILAFDGVMAADSVTAGRYAALRTAVVAHLIADPRLADLLAGSGLPAFWNRWFVPAGSFGRSLPRLLADERPLGLDVAAAVAAALQEVATADPRSTWGDRHRYRADHALVALGVLRTDPDLEARLRAPAVGLGGDTLSVQSNHSTPGVSDLSLMGPVARYVWDLGDRDRSRWVVPMGAAGDPGSTHFSDQLPTWAVGGSVPVVSDWSRLTRRG